MYRSIIAALMIALMLFSSCKKNDKDTVPLKSITELFTNKSWSGLIKYSSSSYYDPYCISFKNTSFLWSERSGDYAGTYIIDEDERKVSLIFTSGGSSFHMQIPGEKKVDKFTYDFVYPWNIQNCEANPTAKDDIVGSKWGIGSGTAIEFISTTDLKFTGTTLPYDRIGAVIRFNTGVSLFFLVFNQNKMQGLLTLPGGSVSSVMFVRQ